MGKDSRRGKVHGVGLLRGSVVSLLIVDHKLEDHEEEEHQETFRAFNQFLKTLCLLLL